MGVKCPKHNRNLDIEYTTLNIMQNKYPVVTGQCPMCKVKYLSREVLSASGSFSIGGQSYEYLNELEMAYPYPFKPLPQTPTTPVKDPVPDPALPIVSAESKSNGTRQQSEKATKEERKLRRKEAGIAATRKRLVSGQIVHVHKLSYPSVMPKVCNKDGEELFYATRVIIDMAGAGIKTRAYYCLKCKTAYILKEDQEKIREEVRKADLRQNLKYNLSTPLSSSRPAPNEPINLAIQQNTLYVCKGIIVCRRNAHDVESATGVMLGKNGAVAKINTNYCPQCRKCFIGYDEYMRYRQIYGVLLGNIKVTNGSFVQSEAELADESILHMCGYSVNQTDNLSSAERHSILQYLIDSKVSNKPEIIEYLNFFIRRNGKRQNMEEAVRRWNEDLRWVREYQLDRQRHFEIVNIQKNGS